MKTIRDVPVQGKRLLFRVDFNVPIDKAGRVAEDTRIRAVLPTLRHALENDAVLIIASHLGRPKGKPVPEYSLRPAAERLGELIGREVKTAPDCVGEEVREMADALKPGEILVLENLRFHPEEEKNDPDFARRLAGLCDVYVNDAFAVSHRAHASVEAITRYAPISVAGFLLHSEIEYFGKALKEPRRPLVAVIGGAKVSSKLKALENLLGHVDKMLIGGAMANTFLKGEGCEVGSSMVEDDLLEASRSIVRRAAEKGVKLYLPVDAVIAEKPEAGKETRVVPAKEIPAGMMALDIGPATSLLFSEALNDAATIVWNGPMGVFEIDAFSKGTLFIAETIADSEALSIVGGGDTDAAVRRAGVADRITYISTGGGAFLELMEGKALPGVAALETAQAKSDR